MRSLMRCPGHMSCSCICCSYRLLSRPSTLLVFVSLYGGLKLFGKLVSSVYYRLNRGTVKGQSRTIVPQHTASLAATFLTTKLFFFFRKGSGSRNTWPVTTVFRRIMELRPIQNPM
ncbi:hypothetical protein F4679DRAFT_562001 [Xylaria curta]|nr:hypothetical protein F4679DRAFT_562001 [Xylaria curta]